MQMNHYCRWTAWMVAIPCLFAFSGCMDVSPNHASTVLREKPESHAATGTPAPSFGETTMAKLAVIGRGISTPGNNDFGRIAEEEFIAELLKKGYTVASRSDVAAVLNEIDFQTRTGLTDANAVRIGKMLNTQGVVIVDFPGTGSKIVYNHREYARLNFRCAARIVGVEANRVLWVGSKDVAEDVPLENLSPAYFGPIIREVAALIPARR